MGWVVNFTILIVLMNCVTDSLHVPGLELEERVNQLETTMTKLVSEMHEQKIQRKSRASVDPMVSFSAVLDHAQYHITIGQTIVFNRVFINDGGGYDNVTGVFTVPSNGVYLFSYFVAEINNDQIVLRLVVDGQNKVDAVAEGLQARHNDQGGNVVILRLSPGQRVYIESYDTSDVHIDGGDGYWYTTFSGTLLYGL